jgi:sestrin
VGVGVDEEARLEAVSTFMSAAEITPIDVAAVDKREVLQRCFLSQGRISHLMRVMVIQPQYLNSFDRAITCLLRAPGPLPLDWRSYIAIMASEVHHCGYMVSRLGIEFLDVGGNEMWLAGLSRAPPKLAKLGELNVTLAHQPWRVAVGHIAALISTGGTDAWSNAELTQAIVRPAPPRPTYAVLLEMWKSGRAPRAVERFHCVGSATPMLWLTRWRRGACRC